MTMTNELRKLAEGVKATVESPRWSIETRKALEEPDTGNFDQWIAELVPAAESRKAEEILTHLESVAYREGLTIIYTDALPVPRMRGMTYGDTIHVRASLPLTERAGVLAHELGHVLLGHNNLLNYPPLLRTFHTPLHRREIEAESVSYLVMKRFGIEMSGALVYIGGWNSFAPDIGDITPSLRAGGADILRVVDSIVESFPTAPTSHHQQQEERVANSNRSH